MVIDHYGDPLPPAAIGRLGNIRFKGGARAMLFLPDGKLLAGGISMRWLDPNTGIELEARKEHKAPLVSLALSPDGGTIASGSEDTTIILWDLRGKKLKHFRQASTDGVKAKDPAEPPPMAVFGLGFFCDGRKLISAHRNGMLLMWDVETEAILKSAQLRKKRLRKIVVSASQNVGCALFDKGPLLGFNLDTGEELWISRSNIRYFGDLAISPDGGYLVSTDAAGVLYFLEAKTGKILHKQQGPKDGVEGIALSPDGSLLAVVGIYGPIRIIASKSLEEVRSIPILGEAGCLSFSPHSKTLALMISGGMSLWDVATGKELMSLAGPSFIQAMSVSPDGRYVALGEAQSVGIWELSTRRQVGQLATASEAVAFSPDGKMVACVGVDEPIRVWDFEKGNAIWSLDAQEWVRALVFSPDGEFLASGDNDTDHGSRIMVWNVKTGKLMVVSQSDSWPSLEKVREEWLRGRLDGTYVSEDDRVAALETATGHVWDCICLAFSPDGAILASAGCETADRGSSALIRLWTFPELTEWRALIGHRGYIKTLAFSPDGRVLASGSDDKTIAIWNLVSRQTLLTLAAHTDTVNSVAFSGDSRFLASGSEDGTICLWDLATGKKVRKLKGHLDCVKKVSFYPKGGILLSASSDSTVLLWDLTRILL
jgi:WD40 repeat protein